MSEDAANGPLTDAELALLRRLLVADIPLGEADGGAALALFPRLARQYLRLRSCLVVAGPALETVYAMIADGECWHWPAEVKNKVRHALVVCRHMAETNPAGG